MSNDDLEGQFLTIKDAARRLRVDEHTIRNWIADGRLAAVTLPVKPGSKRKYRRVLGSSIDAILNNSTTDKPNP